MNYVDNDSGPLISNLTYESKKEIAVTLTSQNLTDDEKATYARMEDKAPGQVNELRNQIMKAHINSNPQLAADIAKEIRRKILENPQLKKDIG
jgi:hypothetical protein